MRTRLVVASMRARAPPIAWAGSASITRPMGLRSSAPRGCAAARSPPGEPCPVDAQPGPTRARVRIAGQIASAFPDPPPAALPRWRHCGRVRRHSPACLTECRPRAPELFIPAWPRSQADQVALALLEDVQPIRQETLDRRYARHPTDLHRRAAV